MQTLRLIPKFSNAECFGITPKGVEIRFDENYNPTPEKPEWVRRLEE